MIDWFDLLAVQGTLKSSPAPQVKSINSSAFCLPYGPSLKCCTWLLERPYPWLYRPFVGKVISLLFNTLSRFVIAFLPKSSCLLISWLQSPFAVILEAKKRKSVTVSIFSLSVCHEVMGQDAMILVFLIVSFKLAFSLSPFMFIKRLFSSFFAFFH